MLGVHKREKLHKGQTYLEKSSCVIRSLNENELAQRVPRLLQARASITAINLYLQHACCKHVTCDKQRLDDD
jgi:hypothetical protein